METKQYKVKDLEYKLAPLQHLDSLTLPPTGWVNTIRTALGITMEQLGKKLGISKQSVSAIEKRELAGTISLQTLNEVADALDMKLVYALVPKDGSLDQLIERKAQALAKTIVARASNTMLLENQSLSESTTAMILEERTAQYKRELPKALWD